MKPDAQDLLRLADAVAAATGPDRRLDARIAHKIAWRWDGWEEGDICIEDRSVEYVIDRVGNSHSSIWQHLPAYTASLDAATTLIPGREAWYVTTIRPHMVSFAAAVYRGPHPVTDYAEAATAPLALCAAALKARAHSTKESNHG